LREIRFNAVDEATFFCVNLSQLKCPLTLDMLTGKAPDINGLITHKFPLAEFEKAIEIAMVPAQKPSKFYSHQEFKE